jgi:diguanylate cyclase (GGDEF)-like protein
MAHEKPAKRARPRILVVEDDASIADMLAKVLSEAGDEVAIAPDGPSAAEKINSFGPDLVLLDLHIPDGSGFDVLKVIRKKDADYGIFVPVIVLTGVYTSRNDKVESLDAGADDFIAKPFDLVELLARVRSLLRVQELYKKSQFLATHDPLTRCYNRRYLMEFLTRQHERFRRYKEPYSFLLLDLDHFKQINDEKGHEQGDEILMQVGFKLQDFFRAVDCVARLGGDEFAAVLPSCDAAQAAKVGQRLVEFMGAAGGLKVAVSVGLASVPDHTKDHNDVVRLADKAMYEAKKAGRNQFRISPSD